VAKKTGMPNGEKKIEGFGKGLKENGMNLYYRISLTQQREKDLRRKG